MRVCYVADYARKVSGSGQSLLSLMMQLRQQGTEPYLVCHKPCELVDFARQEGIPTEVLPFKTHIFSGSRITVRMLMKDAAKRAYNRVRLGQATGYLRRNRIELVHLNSLHSADIWALAARKAGIPYVWHIREYMGPDQNLSILNWQSAMRALHGAAAVIAISRSIKDYWEPRFHGIAKLIYNGLSAEAYADDAPKFGGDTIRCLLVGRVVHGKGQMDAVKAIERVVAAGDRHIFLTIVGYRGFDPYELELKAYIDSRGLSDYIELVDYTYDMAAYRRRSDIGLMCSRAEAFGRVTVEYMMSGLLVFGTNSGGTPELVEDGVDGYLYPVGDSAALARRMLYADEHRSEMQAMAKKGQIKAMERFTIERTAREVLDVYNRIGGGYKELTLLIFAAPAPAERVAA